MNLDQAAKEALCSLLFQMADDELTLGHRDSEWLGIGPDIEEDVAFSSIAQDEVGHASLYYRLLSQLLGEHEDVLAFDRAAANRHSSWLVERENGDWAYSVVRHYLYDVFDDVRLSLCRESSYDPLRQAVEKVQREEYYHLVHGETRMRYLAQGTEESKRRIERALNEAWTDLPNLFNLGQHADVLHETGIFPATPDEVRAKWEEQVLPALETWGLTAPKQVSLEDPQGAGAADAPGSVTRGNAHVPALEVLLDVLREVKASEEEAAW